MKYKLFVITVLASVGFFNFHGLLSDQIVKAIFYLMVLVCFFYAANDGIALRDVKYPRVAYFGMLAGILFSAVMATAFHPQGILVSLMVVLPFVFAFACFWIWLKMGLEPERIMHIYLWLAAVSTFVYFCNVLTMPNNIFGEPIINEDMSRGIVRLPVVFIEFFPMIVFYAINKWILTKEKKWLGVIAVASLMIFLAVIRQIIALTAVLGLWFMFRNVSIWKKLGIVAACVLVVAVVLPRIPMYKTMIELSEDQRDSNDDTEDIRITAWRYYTYENQTNALTPFFGNGIPSFGNSTWGKMMDSETDTLGVYAADVGWAGFFWYFGAFSTICLIVLLVKALLKKKSKEDQYLSYWIVFLMITSIASGPIIYYWQILDVAVCLAMVYYPANKLIETEKKDDDEVDDSPDNTKLQQFKRYPQLH